MAHRENSKKQHPFFHESEKFVCFSIAIASTGPPFAHHSSTHSVLADHQHACPDSSKELQMQLLPKAVFCAFLVGTDLEMRLFARETSYMLSWSTEFLRLKSTACGFSEHDFCAIVRNTLKRGSFTIDMASVDRARLQFSCGRSFVVLDFKRALMDPADQWRIFGALSQELYFIKEELVMKGSQKASMPVRRNNGLIRKGKNPNLSRIIPGTRIGRPPRGVRFDDD